MIVASYLTFFPVAIAQLRGLTSPDPRALELMRSCAASRWTIFWKLRMPASLPYLFAALKIAATASIVGAIVGEGNPGGSQFGLGRAILNFNEQYGSAPEKLWAAILAVVAARPDVLPRDPGRRAVRAPRTGRQAPAERLSRTP